MQDLTGHCLCGAVQFSAAAPPLWSCFCHCESCRRATSSPVTAFVGFRRGDVHWRGGPLRRYRSSAGVLRTFCGECGAPLAYQSDRWPEEIHLYAASLREPAAFAPQFHVHWSEKLPWLEIHDALPKRADGSDGASGG